MKCPECQTKLDIDNDFDFDDHDDEKLQIFIRCPNSKCSQQNYVDVKISDFTVYL